MKAKIDIWTVLQGELKEIKLEDMIYEVHKKEAGEKIVQGAILGIEKPNYIQQKLPITFEKNKQEKSSSTKKIHKVNNYTSVGKQNGMNILKEALEEIKGKTKKQAIKILKKYYPNAKYKSVIRYYNSYKRFTKNAEGKTVKPKSDKMYIGKVQIKKDVLKKYKQSANKKQLLKEYYPKAKKNSLKVYNWAYRKALENPEKISKEKQVSINKKSNKGYYSKRYTCYIKPSEEKLVLDALHTKRGYRPNVTAIMAETKLKDYKVRATLNMLERQGKIYTRKNGTSKTYHLVNTN